MAETLTKTFTPYQPKPDEEYMNKNQLNHFRAILNGWKSDLSHDIDKTVHTMQDEVTMFADPNDRASQESDMALDADVIAGVGGGANEDVSVVTGSTLLFG